MGKNNQGRKVKAAELKTPPKYIPKPASKQPRRKASGPSSQKKKAVLTGKKKANAGKQQGKGKGKGRK
ncbi:hypothetical protein NLI96_g10365 [Meripilus lineatus]|nr:hypothetical protein NLI96_g10365 [Physisporinus lineatus]